MISVTVGRNGSGKSNFFWALRFVLCDAYSVISAQERQGLLHDGGAYQTSSAYVEITFDNSDQRFPIAKDDVVLRRTIGVNKDEHTLNGKPLAKSKVLDFLESAGFSRHNPYYIVPQGRVASLTNAKDSDRLNLFKEIAGTGAYEERRNESIKLMEETNMKRQNVEYSLSQIEERLKELDEEKAHLRVYNELNLQRRTIQYVMCWREIEEINENISGLDEIRKGCADDISALNLKLDKLQSAISFDERQMEYLRGRIKTLCADREELSRNIEKSLKTRAGLEMDLLHIKDIDTLDKSHNNADEKQLKTLAISIAEREDALAKCTERIASARKLEVSLSDSVQLLEQKHEMVLTSRKGLKSLSGNEYSEYLYKEIESSKSLVELYSQKVASSEAKLRAYVDSASSLSQEIGALDVQVNSSRSEFLNIDSIRTKKREELSRLNEKSRDIWKRENVANIELQNALKDFESNRRLLYSLLDKEISDGLDSLQKILHENAIEGCYGPLVELFDADSVYDAAVDIAAGKRLFNVVVESTSVASEIISRLNRKYAGRLTFIPLNDIENYDTCFEDTDDAVSLVRKLEFDPKYAKAFNQVFGRFIVCQSLEVAPSYLKLRNLTSALTLDGDRLDSSGYVSGGYKEVGKSLIAVARSLKACGQKRLEAEKRLASIGQESVEFDKRVTCLRNEILQVDHEHKIISASSSNIIMKLKKLQDEHRNVLALISLETSILENAKAEHRKAECKVRTFASEAGSQKLKNSDYDLEKAGQELQKAKREVSTVIQRCEELESLKRSIELELSENLYRQRDDIRLSARTISESSNAENTLSKRRECTSISGGIISNENSLKSISRELEDSNKLLSQKITEIEDNKQEYQNVKKELDKMRFAMEKCMLKRSNIQRVKQEVTTRIRSLGILPSESFEKYQNKPEPELVEMLHKVNSDLKKHAYANKNAFEQFHAFTRQFEQLSERKNELDTSAAAIRNLVSNLDNRKGEAISKSLAQVCKCFSEVWQKLVPTGKGKLIPLRRIGAVSESQDFDEETSLGSSILSQSQARSDSPASITAKSTLKNGKKSGTIPDIDMYTGVSIKVSFNSSDSEGLRLQQLSGGQKSLVALALIFAIQRCDPAPFYLFDEIDAALDSSYRVSIANIIRELSRTAQFITTTFHRELLDGADKYYGISFSDKVSDIKAISCEEATSFVEDAGK